ncbi:MAG: hypothetical protein ACLTPN_00890 [Clostridia bacterium]|jgi:hypothetical protein
MINKFDMIIEAIKEKYNEEIQKILIKYLEEMDNDSMFLSALQNTGVDNWEGYEYAQELLEEWNDENE